MGRHAYQLSPRALEAAAVWRQKGVTYRDVARLLVRCHLVERSAHAATVRRRLLAAGLADRQRRPPVRKGVG